jgi:FkbM family methyltransferase
MIIKNLGTNKFFVEAGGSDPEDQSNTSFLEKNGWRGLVVEPKLNFNDMYKRYRPNTILENYVLVSNDHVEDYIEGDFSHYMIGGVLNIHNKSWNPKPYPAIQLSKLLNKHQITEVHFMCLDVEGYEEQVLKGIDFDEVMIHVLDVENHKLLGVDQDFSFLENIGFKKIGVVENSHEIYVNKNSPYIETFQI